ncbi:aldo/keto reductase [Streptomyces sp. Ru62]|uniref:aldo/keto reductase n=1 Tax=Streptomyces sp. Ru62 TaxID=2080745 RepID=UPI0015E39E1F|nr:aldo/keto reductase [Streptomyces sp. Ru62]
MTSPERQARVRPVPAQARPPALDLGRLGLGAWLFGWETPAEEARTLMKRALDHGITYFDTANNYGSGESERVVGAFLKPVRDEVLIGTKVFAPFGPDERDRGLSAPAVLRAVDGCLRRLGTDYIDLLHLHRPDPSVPEAETASALGTLVRAGKVRYIATSTFRGPQIDRLQRALRAQTLPPAVLDQAPYSLLEREVEVAAADSVRAWGMGLAAWSPLGEGLLTGKYADPAVSGRLRRWGTEHERRLRAGAQAASRLGAVAASHGLTLPQLALGWLAARPLVSTILIGARTVGQLDTYLDGVGTALPTGVGDQIDRIVPPGTSILRHYST